MLRMPYFFCWVNKHHFQTKSNVLFCYSNILKKQPWLKNSLSLMFDWYLYCFCIWISCTGYSLFIEQRNKLGGKGQCRLKDFAFTSKSLRFFQTAENIVYTIIEVRVSVNLTGLVVGFFRKLSKSATKKNQIFTLFEWPFWNSL